MFTTLYLLLFYGERAVTTFFPFSPLLSFCFPTLDFFPGLAAGQHVELRNFLLTLSVTKNSTEAMDGKTNRQKVELGKSKFF